MDARKTIGTYIRRVLAEPIRDDDDFFDLGLADSLFALQLVAYVEREFSIVAEREDLDIRNFCSIAAVSAFVENKLRPGVNLKEGHGNPAD